MPYALCLVSTSDNILKNYSVKSHQDIDIIIVLQMYF